MELSTETIKSILKDVTALVHEKQDKIYDDLLDIGSDHYKGGYGMIIDAIQEKYILIPREDIQ